jgi:hypothetical protein
MNIEQIIQEAKRLERLEPTVGFVWTAAEPKQLVEKYATLAHTPVLTAEPVAAAVGA